ncbi:hypothetical protein BS47DRAFT_57258 [Hydnum rufescens UP504]|uniref:Uncharacterized protein n=1 Tax=Hydnum rufescens UP504 TaxID=1448309 RepID=A0A9P6ATM3_9AGAM|nr:hypothetical protein BS47DRAFT_57258 [Hydnum rufescens UP504]
MHYSCLEMGEWDTGSAEVRTATMASEEVALTQDPVREKITDLEARIQELERLLKEKDAFIQAQSASETTPQDSIPEIAESISASANGTENRTSVQQPIDKLTAVQNAISANKAHQQALQARSTLLKAELARADKLFAQVDRGVDEDVDELSVDVPEDWAIFVAPGGSAVRPLLSKKQICLEDSPFLEDAARYKRYVSLTTPHTFNSKERTALAAALRSENMRLYAFELATSGVSDPLEEVRKQPTHFTNHNMKVLIGIALPIRSV